MAGPRRKLQENRLLRAAGPTQALVRNRFNLKLNASFLTDHNKICRESANMAARTAPQSGRKFLRMRLVFCADERIASNEEVSTREGPHQVIFD